MTEYNIITSDYFSNYSDRIFKFKKKRKKKAREFYKNCANVCRFRSATLFSPPTYLTEVVEDREDGERQSFDECIVVLLPQGRGFGPPELLVEVDVQRLVAPGVLDDGGVRHVHRAQPHVDAEPGRDPLSRERSAAAYKGSSSEGGRVRVGSGN